MHIIDLAHAGRGIHEELVAYVADQAIVKQKGVNRIMKTALIIGGSSGMGLDVAKRLAARGVAVTITGREAGKLAKAASELKQAGGPKANTKVLDLYDRTQVDAYLTGKNSTQGGDR